MKVSQRRVVALLLSAVVLLACALSTVGCGSGGGSATADPDGIYTGVTPGDDPQQGGVLTFANSGLPSSLDPATLSVSTPPQIFDQLVEMVPGSDEPKPDLATSWTISSDGLTYDFKLRSGVKFSNGEPLTADDVAYTLRRMAGPENQTGQFIFPDTFKSVTAVSPTEVRFVLNKPVAAMIYYLADPEVSIVPEDLAGMSPAEFGTHPIGSGPFMVKSFKPGNKLELVKNPHYRVADQPYLDGVTILNMPEANQRILSVRSGEADAADVISYSQIPSLVDDPSLQMTVQPLFGIDNVIWNTSKPPFDDVKVRQGLAYATPIDDIIDTVYHGYAEPANTIIPKNEFWDPSMPYYTSKPSKAAELMSESSVPNGFAATIMIPGGNPDATLLASILQDAWSKVGVKLSVEQTDINTVWTRLIGGNYEVAAVESGSFVTSVPAPDNAGGLVYDFESGTNGLGSWYDSPKETELYRSAASATSESLRRRNFEELQAMSHQSAQMLPIGFVPQRYLLGPDVRNFVAVAGGWVRLGEVYLAP